MSFILLNVIMRDYKTLYLKARMPIPESRRESGGAWGYGGETFSRLFAIIRVIS
jgi:hypothetical protein